MGRFRHLSTDERYEIIDRLKKETGVALAAEFNCTTNTIYNIKKLQKRGAL